MPREQRSPEEIELVRQEIMEHALAIIVSDGLEDLSMRKLAGRLGVTAKTIYNYFHNKDEIYLYLLIRGFKALLASFEKSVKNDAAPFEQFRAAVQAYIDFGLDQSNIYNLMFTWHTPKYNDYVGSPMEEVAAEELAAAMKCADFFYVILSACAGEDFDPQQNNIRRMLVPIWSHMHGYVSGINNTLLDYLDEKPLTLKNRIIDQIITSTQREVATLRKRMNLRVLDKA